MGTQKIKCDVGSCKYINEKCTMCELSCIKVSHNTQSCTLCASYKER